MIQLLIYFFMVVQIESLFSSDPIKINHIYKDIKSGIAPLTNKNSFITEKIKYNPILRPTGIIGKNTNINRNGALKIDVTLSLNQIVSIDEKSQILTTSFNLLLSWQDPRFMWNPIKYNNTLSGTIPIAGIWLPDLAILNSASQSNLIAYPPNQNAIVTFEGRIYMTLSLPSQQTRCRLNVYKYPFDTQNCGILIGSWMNDMGQIVFSNSYDEKIDTINYINHPIWELKEIKIRSILDSSRFKSINYDWGDFKLILKEYPTLLDDLKRNEFILEARDVAFNFIIKRNPLYIMVNGILPSFVLNCVVLIAFALPFTTQVGFCMHYFC
jgi:hypothetical protein